MKKALLTTALVCSVLASPVMVMATDAVKPPVQEPAPTPISDDFKYDIKYWSPELLAQIERGPRILSADMALDLKPYPANTSEETKAELEALKKFAAEERTDAQLARIQLENKVVPLYLIYSQDGFYDFDSHPITNSLLASVDRDVSYFILREKKAIQRPRPTQLAPELTTVIPVPPHSAYPSGHAGQSYASALVLAEIDPANAEKYKQLALDIAHRREIAGVHYPSDGVVGRALATQVVAAILAKPEIQERVALAKKEFEVQLAKEHK
jgi:acid phosphatase (class A)